MCWSRTGTSPRVDTGSRQMSLNSQSTSFTAVCCALLQLSKIAKSSASEKYRKSLWTLLRFRFLGPQNVTWKRFIHAPRSGFANNRGASLPQHCFVIFDHCSFLACGCLSFARKESFLWQNEQKHRVCARWKGIALILSRTWFWFPSARIHGDPFL